jgi:hypothetical protein
LLLPATLVSAFVRVTLAAMFARAAWFGGLLGKVLTARSRTTIPVAPAALA